MARSFKTRRLIFTNLLHLFPKLLVILRYDHDQIAQESFSRFACHHDCTARQNQILPAELRFVTGEAFAGGGEVFVDRCEIFQRPLKILTLTRPSATLSHGGARGRLARGTFGTWPTPIRRIRIRLL